MKISCNELLLSCRKAFEGLGFRSGDAHDSAEMVAWLELHGLHGVSELSKALHFLEKEGKASPRSTLNLPMIRILDADGASVLCTGGLAVDCGVAMARAQGLSTVHLLNCHNRALIVGYLVHCARRGISVLGYWHNGGAPGLTTVVSLRAGEAMPTLLQYEPQRPPEKLARRSLTLMFSEDFDLLPQFHPDICGQRVKLSVDPDSLNHTAERNVEQGLEVDDETWSAIKTLGARVLVAGDERSRAQGAGLGADSE